MVKKVSRGAPVVRRTLDATLYELAHRGYASLRVEDVATRARVNKTTVYRRFPTKEELVRAALLSLAERGGGLVVPDTGTLEGDLTAIVQRHVTFARSREGAVIVRMLTEGTPDADLIAISRSIRHAHEVVLRTVLDRARNRGLLRPEVDTSVFVHLLQVSCDRARLERMGPQFVKSLVDLLVMGALATKLQRNGQLR